MDALHVDLNWIYPLQVEINLCPLDLRRWRRILGSAEVAQASFWWRGGALLLERGGIGVHVIRCVSLQRWLAAEP